MTPRNTTPEGFRTAAYLATKARLDAEARSRTGKTRRQVTCTPPNVRCGNRCIPPNWDCRLNNKGSDPHLRAVRTDPVSGLANIERGVKRLRVGLRKASFSEIEGGKRAIVRGIVKATPGDLQRKKALRAQLERRAGGIALGLSIVGFGLFSHNQLKRAPFYRDGVGRQIDDAVAAGINRVLDATPGIRGARAERRAAGAAAAGAAVARAAGEAAAGPATLRRRLLETPTQLEQRATEYANSRVLFNRMSAIDIDAPNRGANDATWRQQSLEAFWSTKRTNAAGVGDGSTFSEPATHEYLSRQFGFRLGAGSSDIEVRRNLTNALNREATSLQALARQERVNLQDAEQRASFLNRLVGPSTDAFPTNVRERAVSNLDRILGTAPSAKNAAVSRTELANQIYRETRDGFDQYFGQISDEVRQVAGVAMPRAQRQAGYSDLLTSARIGHSRYLAQRLNKPSAVRARMNQGLSDAVAKEYYARQVMKSSTFSLSDREMRAAASELAGRDITGLADATRFLQENGFPRLVPVQSPGAARAAASPAAPTTPPPRGRRNTQAQITDLARSLREAARARGEDMSLEASYNAARSEITRRSRGDALPPGLVRTATYLAVREDLRGKPCGASHIPKAHECRQGQGEGARRQQLKQTVGAAALAAGVAAGATALALNPKLRQRARVEGRLLLEGSDKAIRQALLLGGRGTIAGLSTSQVKTGLNKLPEAFQSPARRLVGAAKQAAASMALKAEGYSVQDIDVANNFSTWKNKKGTFISIGSYGDSLVTYASDKSHEWNGKSVYKIGFNVDQTFDATRTIPAEQSRTITTAVRKMTDNHLGKIKDGILATFPWDGDDYGAKRRAIYARAGFNNIAGEESQWALVQKGAIKKMSASESFLYLAESGERDAPIYKPTKTERKDQALRKATYLAVREDLRGKPCGASHIPKAHECTKGQGTAVPPSSDNKRTAPVRAALALAALGATAAAGVYVLQDMKRVAKEPNMFAATPSTRAVAKSAKKEFDTKKSATAMGMYYTKKSGLKPGDVVYYRNEKDPAAHFGIYIGEGKDGKVRAVLANTNETRAGFIDVVELGTTKPDSNDASHFMFPVLQKAPPLKGAKARTNEETVRRAIRAVGSDYKFSLTQDNCEVLANSVAYDTPRSQQLERFKRLTRVVADSTIGARQRAGMAVRRARGQRKTKALTAQQILQRLSKDDSNFLTNEGKQLAQTHYSQFFENTTKLDAASPMPAALISPEALWERIKNYDDNKKAISMRDYLLVLRIALGTDATA